MEKHRLNHTAEPAAFQVQYGGADGIKGCEQEETGFRFRGGLVHTRNRIKLSCPVRIAFLGGSITEGAGASEAERSSWRALTGFYLSERLGSEQVSCVNAGVGGTSSVFGAHRLCEHVLSQGPIDLLFVEFSVNDGSDQLDRAEVIRGMEGIVRQMKRLSPQTDICFVYTASERNLSAERPEYIAIHEQVAEHYQLPSVNLAYRVYQWLQAEAAEWTDLAPDGYHPNDKGHALYARYMKEFLEKALSVALSANLSIGPVVLSHSQVVDKSLPKPMDPASYEFAAMALLSGLEEEEQGGIRLISQRGFNRVKLEADAPLMNWRYDTEHLDAELKGAELVFHTWGKSAGVSLLCGPDSGIFEYSVNGAEFVQVNPFDEWCLVAYRPVHFLFPLEAERGPVHVILRSTGLKDERSSGCRVKVLRLLSN
ncbi:hypothetical protein AWM70_06775 [Paenibacillus yonginensis]|uniref:SGNH hydrolase-type esterase domain-containing protein n=1 Tax=Paenibacillus yonginensis TaxID=1462996 RepID=A0A1B1MYQ8_9BACL|nr:SGNH/GDSL hydrolase family protein [Paenibacillus yonginensis]ANS74322.1 hypothetical protein AWM70_06775 [Paenibacillus yonginensis]